MNENISGTNNDEVDSSSKVGKKRKVESAVSCVIWDIDDTIVVIQASLKIAKCNQQQELVSIVKDYLNAYLEKELYFNETEEMIIAGHISDWEKDTAVVPLSDLTSQSSDIISQSKTYAAYLRSHYQSFKHEQSNIAAITTNATATAITTDPKTDNKTENVPHYNFFDINSSKNTKEDSDIANAQRLPSGWIEILNDMEKSTGMWRDHTKTVLSHLKKKNVRNIIVTASELVPAIAKLILWDLSDYFDIDDIYSSARRSKTDLFLRILQDLGNCNYVPEFVAACGDGPDEEHAAFTYSIPFKKILSPLDLYFVPSLLHEKFNISTPPDFFFSNTENLIKSDDTVATVKEIEEVLNISEINDKKKIEEYNKNLFKYLSIKTKTLNDLNLS